MLVSVGIPNTLNRYAYKDITIPDFGEKVNKLVPIFIAISLVIVTTYVCLSGEKTVLKVYHAGSLTVPFKEIEKQFESSYHVDVQLEPHGSVEAIGQITELHKAGDIVVSADYSLIPKMMIPEYTDWYIQFARNEMVLAYTPGSVGGDEVNENNWYEILKRPKVRFGFSNPNLDPCGYRSLMALQLAEVCYDNSTIFDDLIAANTNIKVSGENGHYLIKVPQTEDLGPNTEKVRIEGKSVELLSLLATGSIDYAFEYRSVAVQHDLRFVELPDEINLSSMSFENTYGRVKVRLADGRLVVGKPIVYGVTIPKNAPHKDMAINFVRLMITEGGRRTFEEFGQPPIVPAVASDTGKLPENLRLLVVG